MNGSPLSAGDFRHQQEAIRSAIGFEGGSKSITLKNAAQYTALYHSNLGGGKGFLSLEWFTQHDLA